VDILENKTLEIKCLDRGLVKLIDVMPRIVPEGQTADFAIVQAARVSYGDGTKTLNEDRGLIRYLMRHRHTTPLEMVEFKFHCKMPIFIARQWIRHRTANVNEYSGRYSIIKDEWYIPELENVRKQSKTNKQGGNELIQECDAKAFNYHLDELCYEAYSLYQTAINTGVSREQARLHLPINFYTEWYWKIDLHNLLHFLALRCDSHAQQEIQVYGNGMLNLIKPVVPISVEAWEDYHPMRGGILLTRLEIDAIQSAEYKSGCLECDTNKFENKREREEFEGKLQRLGIVYSNKT
jgi:thymidylate synthase (FAD)